MIEKIAVEGLARLFRNNIWKLHKLPECVIFNKESQFAVELIKKLNKILGIKMKLSTAFHSQTNKQMERTNQELEQYLRIYINHRQNNWLEWLVTAKFIFNNKIYTVTKLSLFKTNYGQKLRMGFEIRKKKYTKTKKLVRK